MPNNHHLIESHILDSISTAHFGRKGQKSPKLKKMAIFFRTYRPRGPQGTLKGGAKGVEKKTFIAGPNNASLNWVWEECFYFKSIFPPVTHQRPRGR